MRSEAQFLTATVASCMYVQVELERDITWFCTQCNDTSPSQDSTNICHACSSETFTYASDGRT
uniref:Uncharacterized protein n=1 Tax=Anguilla anguilla TaxID=7936 RepID=A0A0E9WG04_ANGAN